MTSVGQMKRSAYVSTDKWSGPQPGDQAVMRLAGFSGAVNCLVSLALAATVLSLMMAGVLCLAVWGLLS